MQFPSLIGHGKLLEYLSLSKVSAWNLLINLRRKSGSDNEMIRYQFLKVIYVYYVFCDENIGNYVSL